LSSLPELSLNPLKRVNSILTKELQQEILAFLKGLNPLKRVNSILTRRSKMNLKEFVKSLNPLKRVNSILTALKSAGKIERWD